MMAGLALSLAAVTGTTTIATPAHAAWSCSNTYSCYWDGFDATGVRWVAPTGGWHTLSDYGMQARISSLWNRGGPQATVNLYNINLSWLGAYAPGFQGNVGSAVNNNSYYVYITV
jgi:hypothetical protein